ncbi:MAG: TonB-dependent receptor, partial [Myxococcota bacterium]
MHTSSRYLLAGALWSLGTPAAGAQERTDRTTSIDVTVDGDRSGEPGPTRRSAEEIRRLPGAFGDPFRAIGAMPGVTPTVSGLPFFYVRGSPPGNVGYYLDGIPVPYLFHVLGGPSVLHPALIGEVELYPGAYPLEFGRYAGGIVTGATTAPRSDWHGHGTLRLLDVGGIAEGGLADGKATLLLGGRYSYTGAIFSAISPDLTLDYRDAQARFTYALNERERITVLAFGAYDYLAEKRFDVEDPIFATEFYRAQLRYDRDLDGGRYRADTFVGIDRSLLDDGRRTNAVLLGSRTMLTHRLGADLAGQVGLDVQHRNYRVENPPFSDPRDPEANRYNALFSSRNEANAGAWLGLVYRSNRFAIEPGLRAELYIAGPDTAFALEPRVSAIATLVEGWRLRPSLGLAHQLPAYLAPVPGLTPVGLEDGLQQALQSSLALDG